MTLRISLVAALVTASVPAAAQEAFPTLPVRFAVAELDGAPVVTEAWLTSQVEHANRIFAPAGVSFEVDAIVPLDARHAMLEDRPDRHALGGELAPGVINVFVVASLRDVDDPSRLRMGVHWRPHGHPGAHLVIVSRTAAPTVLAHELGHFFGNRQHSETRGNIMSYDRGDGEPFFDAAQIARIRRFARRFLRTRELIPPRGSQMQPLGAHHSAVRSVSP